MLIPAIPVIQQDVIQPTKQIDGTTTYQMHPAWHSFFSQLITEMQRNVSNEAYVFPGLTNDQRTVLSAKSAYPQSIIYNLTDGYHMLTDDGVTYKQIATV